MVPKSDCCSRTTQAVPPPLPGLLLRSLESYESFVSTGGPITTDSCPVPLFGVPLLCLLLDSQVSTSCTAIGRLFINSQCLLLTRITITDPLLQSLEPVLSNWSFTQGPCVPSDFCHHIALNKRRQRLPMPTRPFWYASGKCCWVLLHTGTA